MIWETLIKIALIGTDRASLPEEEKEKLRSIGIDPDVDNAQAILEAAAFYAPVMKAGYQPKKWKGEIPTPSFIEKQKTCSSKSAKHLSLMLTGRYDTALPEFIELMAQHQQCLPAHALPDLLEKSQSDQELWNKILPIIGERGHWLIEQNPDWQNLGQVKAPMGNWEDGIEAEQIQILEHYRSTTPSKARELLQSIWAELPVRTQAKFLKTFKVGLSQEDEPFLEELLDARRKGIRTLAAELLQQLPASRLVNRMFERVKNLMTIKKGKKEKLNLDPPESLTPEMMRDGIGTNKNKGTTKASWLVTMFSTIPPNRWEAYFKADVNTVLDFFVRTAWGAACLEGLKEASAKYQDENWIKALLLFWIKNHDKARWDSFKMEKELDNISDETFNAVAITGLKNKAFLDADDSAMGLLLRSGTHQWSDQLFQLFFRNLQEWLSNGHTQFWEGWQYRAILKKAAYGCSPKILATVKKDLEAPGRHWLGWEKDMDSFVRGLRFRKEMWEGFK